MWERGTEEASDQEREEGGRGEQREGKEGSQKGNLKTSSKTIRAGNFWRITNLSIIDCQIFILVK